MYEAKCQFRHTCTLHIENYLLLLENCSISQLKQNKFVYVRAHVEIFYGKTKKVTWYPHIPKSVLRLEMQVMLHL